MAFWLDGDLCPLCYRSRAGAGHRVYFDGDLTCCEQELVGPGFPRDPETLEPLVFPAAYVDDVWAFGIACIHSWSISRERAEAGTRAFLDRWPVGGALLFEAVPIW